MIKLLWPTCRVEAAIRRAGQWCERANSPESFEFYFGVNDDTAGQATLATVKPGTTIVRTGDKTGAAHSATFLTRNVLFLDTDIIVLASDDFEPPQKWDLHLTGEYLEFDGCLIVDDGYAKETNIIPMPVVSGEYLRRLGGILYNPHYHHFYSDEELFYTCCEIGDVKNLRKSGSPVFHHRHWSFNGRDRDLIDERNNQKWNQDKQTYLARKSLPLAEKLKLPEGWK